LVTSFNDQKRVLSVAILSDQRSMQGKMKMAEKIDEVLVTTDLRAQARGEERAWRVNWEVFQVLITPLSF
jgi:hypothetical protein